jgi:Tol biopolymer transport system component
MRTSLQPVCPAVVARQPLWLVAAAALVALALPAAGRPPPSFQKEKPEVGQKVVFHWMNRGLCLANPDGTMTTLILPDKGDHCDWAVDRAFRLSPDRRRVLFHHGRSNPGDSEFLSLLDVKDKRFIDLEENPLGHCWSTDGRRVLFGHARKGGGTEVVSLDPDDTRDRKVLFHLPHAVFVEDCSPDGKRLLLTVEGKKRFEWKQTQPQSVRKSETEVYAVDLSGKNLTRLTGHGSVALRPRFSPDGKKVLFVSFRSGTSQVLVMDADGGNQRQLTDFPIAEGRLTGAIFNCTWSPDGKKIMFSWNPLPPRDGKSAEMYVADSDGKNPTVWMAGEKVICPDWR